MQAERRLSDDDGVVRAYRLLSEVMRRADRAAVGPFVMRAKDHLVIVRERTLTLSTMLFADEVRSREGIETATQESHRPTRKQLEAAVAVIEELSAEWDPASTRTATESGCGGSSIASARVIR